MTDILRLPSLVVRAVVESDSYYRIKAEARFEPTACPECHAGLYRHGSKVQEFMDTPVHGQRVIIEVNRRRYRCRNCGKTLFQPLPDMDDKRLATERLVRYIEKQSLRRTFADVAREIGVDDKTIRHIFDDYVRRLESSITFETPRILGIDELKIIGDYRAIVTNVERLTIYDLLPTRKKASLLDYFRTLKDKDAVEVVVMDMYRTYRDVVRQELPGRMIVVDRFHAVRMANEALEKVRKQVRKELPKASRLRLKDERFLLLKSRHALKDDEREKLDVWFEKCPSLAAAYAAKEAFRDIYDNCTSKHEAITMSHEWESNVPHHIEWAFAELMTALSNWRDEICSYFQCPVTNGYTESVNNLAKGINRMGRGYSFEVIRARLLYDQEARKDSNQVIRKKNKGKGRPEPITELAFFRAMSVNTDDSQFVSHKVIEYGPYIPTLVRKLEAGEFA